MQVGRTFGPTNANQNVQGGGGQGPTNPVADAIRILSLQLPQTMGANTPTGVGMNTPSMMGGQMGSGLLLQWLRSLLGGGGQPGGSMPGGGMPGGGMPGGMGGGGRFGTGMPGGMTPAFNFTHGAGQPSGPGGQQLPQPPAPPVMNGPQPPAGGGNGVNWAQGFNGPNPNPGMDGTMLAGRR